VDGDAMVLPVEKTFEDFVLKYGGELVNNLVGNNNPPKNADYLFRSPLAIAELKIVQRKAFTLQDQQRLNALARVWMDKGQIPRIFGTRSIDLRNLPPQCQKEWLHVHMAPRKRKLEDANKQIKQTKASLNIPDACGILFIVDDAAHSFPPIDVMGFIARNLQSRKPDGMQIYSHIDRIIYFSVNLRAVADGGIGLHFWIPAYRNINDKENNPVSEFLDDFRQKWIQYHAGLLGTKPVQMPPQDQPFMGTWTDGMHGLRIKT
jgi:hypothetical protein